MLVSIFGGARQVEATTVFNNQVSFLAVARTVTTEDFEDEPLIGTPDSNAVTMIVFDDFTAISTPEALKILNKKWYGNHNTTPGGENYLSADTDIAFQSSEVTLTFNYPISAFGLYLIDIEEPVVLTIDRIDYTVPASGDAGESYFGIITSRTFTSVHLDMGNLYSHSSMDDIAYAYIPEPATLVFLAVGGLAMLRRRRA